MNLKSYIHDKKTIFFNIVLVLIGLLDVLLVVVRIDTTQSVAIIRNNTTLGLTGFDKSSTSSLYQFVIIALLVVVFHTLFSIRIHSIKKALSPIVLGLGIIALVFLWVVSSAILGLHR